MSEMNDLDDVGFVTPAPGNVIQALAAVSADLTAISKGREAQGYKFRGIEDMYNALHGPLARHGVVIVPRAVYHSVTPLDFGNKTADRGWHKVSLVVEFDVYGPGGTEDRLPTPGRVAVDAEDNTDKGFGKAMSYAYKNFCVQLFSIPTEDVAIDNEVPTYGYPPASDDAIKQLADRCRSLPDPWKGEAGQFCKDLMIALKPGRVPEDRAVLLANKLDALEALAAQAQEPPAASPDESEGNTAEEPSEPSGAQYVPDTEDPKMPDPTPRVPVDPNAPPPPPRRNRS